MTDQADASATDEAPATLDELDERRAFFASRSHRRYWWYRKTNNAYVPDVYRLLSDAEWHVLRDWFVDTEQREMMGECSVPLISWLTSYISGNGISRVVQLGTYVGYSALLLGWTLRRMGMRHALLTVDNDPVACEYAAGWLTQAGLDDVVKQHFGESAAPDLPAIAAEYLGGPPQLVFIDSSHQYAHTLRELDLWYGAVPPGSIIVMHDVSQFAAAFDRAGEGGVHRALAEWSASHPNISFGLEYPEAELGGHVPSYLDPCGVGFISKQRDGR